MTVTRKFTNITYCETPQRRLCLDLRVPPSCHPPLVLYIPVGGMRVCAREQAPWWLTDHGFAMASIDCRVSSEALAPAAVHDCKAAVRWLRSRAPEYGYRSDSIGVWGQSAGGLLAALMGTSGGVAALEGPAAPLDASSRVQAVCDECGAPHDFQWFARPDIKARFAPVVENLRLWLGGLVEERAELARQVSPATYISPACPPMFLIHGDADPTVPVEETVAFHRLLQQAGVDATLRILPGVGHSWPASLTQADIAAFFARVLRP